jgi:Fe2+ or Zn2+ uptake regulation protein
MSTAHTDQLHQILTDNGYHVTKAREATFGLLQSPSPLSVREILDKSAGTVDRVSIYRNLELFEKLGIVHRIHVGWKYKLELSDSFVAHHHHLSCLTCGKTIDIQDEKHIDEFIREIAAASGFTPRRHQFEIDGYCRECQDKPPTSI